MEVKDEDWEKALSDKDKYKVAADRVRPTDHMDEKARAEEGAAKWPTYAGECERMRRWNIPSTPRGPRSDFPKLPASNGDAALHTNPTIHAWEPAEETAAHRDAMGVESS